MLRRKGLLWCGKGELGLRGVCSAGGGDSELGRF